MSASGFVGGYTSRARQRGYVWWPEKARGWLRARGNACASPGGIIPPVSNTPRRDCPRSWLEGGSGPKEHAKGACITGGGGGKGEGESAIPELLRPALIQSPAGRQAHSNVTNHAGAMPGSLLPDQDQEQDRIVSSHRDGAVSTALPRVKPRD